MSRDTVVARAVLVTRVPHTRGVHPTPRFAFDFNLMRRVKLSDRFFLQPRMKASEFLRAEVMADGAGGEDGGEGDGTAGGDQEYELFAIMIHQGTARGGHYFAYIKVRAHSSVLHPGQYDSLNACPDHSQAAATIGLSSTT